MQESATSLNLAEFISSMYQTQTCRSLNGQDRDRAEERERDSNVNWNLVYKGCCTQKDRAGLCIHIFHHPCRDFQKRAEKMQKIGYISMHPSTHKPSTKFFRQRNHQHPMVRSPNKAHSSNEKTQMKYLYNTHHHIIILASYFGYIYLSPFITPRYKYKDIYKKGQHYIKRSIESSGTNGGPRSKNHHSFIYNLETGDQNEHNLI